MQDDRSRAVDPLEPDEELARGETGVRILLTLLFFVIAAALEAVLTVVIAFGLLWALVTRLPPSRRVRDLANRAVTYYYRIGRYMTYNDARPPFPFSDFPQPIEPDRWDASVRQSESLGLGREGRPSPRDQT